MLNDALFYESYEIIGGEKFMSPSPNIDHSSIVTRLIIRIGMYVTSKRLGYIFADNMDVHLPDGNTFKPDFMFVSLANSSIVLKNRKGTIRGVPDFVVEICSKSTMRRDLTVKKDIYESNGVKEYWIIDPWKESISVFNLIDGKFVFDDEYIYYDKYEWEDLTDEQRAEAKLEINVATIEGLTVKLNDIFDWVIRED